MATTDALGVGIIGLSARGGWASGAHVPALAAVPGLELRALAASSIESARAAGEKFGVQHNFSSADELVACDDVDLVVVTVQAAHHHELVALALDAGKAVYCEWPLAVEEAQAADLVARAEKAGARTAVGLQARSSPTFRLVRDLIADGWVGEVLSTSVIASGMAWGGAIETRTAYTLDRDRGSTMLSIPFGHVVDVVTMCLGEFTEVAATIANRRPTVLETSTGERVPKTADDQVAVSGVLDSGAVASLHARGGRTLGTNFLWEINGTGGVLQLTGAHGHIQLAPVTLRGAHGEDTKLHHLEIPAEYYPVPEFRDKSEQPAANLAAAYASLRTEWDDVTRTVPDFEHGRQRHHLLDTIVRSATAGRREQI